MACLLQRITSMKLQNNWYVWQISLHLYIIFVPRGTYSCEACTESLHLSRLAATVFAKKKSPDRRLLPPTIAILLLPFPFQLCASRWFLVFLFFFFFLVPKSLLCCSHCFGPVLVYCPIIFHLCCFTSF